MCDECVSLLEYAEKRVKSCPIKENKPVCSNCKIHCYKPDMRKKIKAVMRFSGPRLLFYKPIWGIKYLIKKIRDK